MHRSRFATLADYLVNSCRSFIYSTALPGGVIAANLAAIELLEEEPLRRKVLLENARFFRDELRKKGFEIKSQSQIVPLIVGDADSAVALSERLERKGYWALPIRPPTVPAGQCRVRFSLCYHHSREILADLLEQIGRASDV